MSLPPRSKIASQGWRTFQIFDGGIAQNFDIDGEEFSRKAPTAPNFGGFVPKTLPPTPNFMRGKITKERSLMGGIAPLPPKYAPLVNPIKNLRPA